jgi:hypothetical protein
MENCGTCCFFMASGEGNGGVGFCRRYPPQVFIMQQPPQQTHLQISGRHINMPAQTVSSGQYPPVMPVNWCGEFAMASVPAIKER